MRRFAASLAAPAAVLACVVLAAAPALGQGSGRRDAAPKSAAPSAISARVGAILDQYTEDPDAASAAMQNLFATMVAHAGVRDPAWREVAAWRRLLGVVAEEPESERAALLRSLRAAPTFATHLAMALTEYDKPGEVAVILGRLCRERGEHLEKYATLAAAICVVHDVPLTHRVNENQPAAADPLAIFDFFRTTEGSTLMGLRAMPTDLLVHVVDTTAPIDEMAWAQQKYRGDRSIGQRFFDIKYDEDHYYKNTPKKITVAGFGFRNILTHGGVCIDQAYFAAHAGKSIGVPTAIISGRSSTVSHAWVGYLQARGKTVEWNFDTGRYDAYQIVRGMVDHPQTRQRIPDSYLGVAAQAMTDPAEKRFLAVALTDAAQHLGQVRRRRLVFPPARPDPAVPVSSKPRGATAAAQLDLLDAALRTTPASVRGWQTLADMAKAGDLSVAQLREWSATLFQLCGRSYPEFSLDVLAPMISGVPGVRDQDALWNAAFKNYSGNPDLGAQIRFAQGRMWEKEGDYARAWECYQDVIARYPNTSSQAVDAAAACRRLLQRTGKDKALLPMLEAAWKKTQRPSKAGPAFAQQSNWFRLGSQYAEALEEAGRAGDAKRVRSILGL